MQDAYNIVLQKPPYWGGWWGYYGRMYDPVLRQMLSPDPVLQDPSNTQNYNKYAYVFNNPLKYTDPSGFIGTPMASGESMQQWSIRTVFDKYGNGLSGDGFGGGGSGYGDEGGYKVDGMPASAHQMMMMTTKLISVPEYGVNADGVKVKTGDHLERVSNGLIEGMSVGGDCSEYGLESGMSYNPKDGQVFDVAATTNNEFLAAKIRTGEARRNGNKVTVTKTSYLYVDYGDHPHFITQTVTTVIGRFKQGTQISGGGKKPTLKAQSSGGGSDKDIYLGIAGGVVSGMELSYLNDAKQVLKYGQRIDGKVRSAETLTRANRISSTATAKYLGYAGKALGIYGAYDAGTKLLNDPSNPANWVKFGASTGMLFMKANPLNFVLGVGYTVLDQGGYIDDWIGNKP